MTSFLEKFKGKTSLVPKDGLLSSLEKSSIPVQKPLLIKPPRPENACLTLTKAKSVKSALLPQKTSETKPKKDKTAARERKIKSFSGKTDGEKPENLLKKVRNLVVQTETDLQGEKPRFQQFQHQKSAPVSVRGSPLLLKEKPLFQETAGKKPKFNGRKPGEMAEIDENEEFQDAQRLHFEFLSRVEKLSSGLN